MDIVVFTPDQGVKHCIELKFPTKGQYPEQMFSAFKDVKFLEQLVNRGFNKCYFIMFAEDPLFYESRDGETGIYKKFRGKKLISGKIKKPTGGKDQVLQIRGKYEINWMELRNNLRCFIIEVNN